MMFPRKFIHFALCCVQWLTVKSDTLEHHLSQVKVNMPVHIYHVLLTLSRNEERISLKLSVATFEFCHRPIIIGLSLSVSIASI
ncbi:MAG: hypothetical protein IBX70_13630 [Clostridia bacterium]|nr:hypothetical protein [Clostridia bacterium]